MNMLANWGVAVMAASVVGFLTFVTTMPSHSQGVHDIDPEPLLMRCDVDPMTPPSNRKFICTHVLELPAVKTDEDSPYGHSNEDPKDPSNDPKRNHDER